MELQADGSLSVTFVLRNDAGPYTCRLHNAHHASTASITLYLDYQVCVFVCTNGRALQASITLYLDYQVCVFVCTNGRALQASITLYLDYQVCVFVCSHAGPYRLPSPSTLTTRFVCVFVPTAGPYTCRLHNAHHASTASITFYWTTRFACLFVKCLLSFFL